MGVQVNLRCDCGYEKRVSIGGGMANYKTVCDFPHYCRECGVVTANTYDDPVHCPSCNTTDIIRYGQTEVPKSPDEGEESWLTPKKYTWDPYVTNPVEGRYESSWSLRLTEGDHLCPACLHMTLRYDPRTTRRFD